VLPFCQFAVVGQHQPAPLLVPGPLELPLQAVSYPTAGLQGVVHADKSGVDRWTINAARIPQRCSMTLWTRFDEEVH
jgi:hypothetical protein